jgi:hypothetical protein
MGCALRVGTGGCHVGSWVDETAAVLATSRRGLWYPENVAFVLRLAIEEAARRAKGAACDACIHDLCVGRRMAAQVIEAMLTDETQRGGG